MSLKFYLYNIFFTEQRSMEELEYSFLQWARSFLNCSEEQSMVLLQRTQDLLNKTNATIPAQFSCHEIPFQYCSTYLRENCAVVSRPVTPPITKELRMIAIDIGVRLNSLKSDVTLANLQEVQKFPDKIDFDYLQKIIGHQVKLVDKCRQLDTLGDNSASVKTSLMGVMNDLHTLAGDLIRLI